MYLAFARVVVRLPRLRVPQAVDACFVHRRGGANTTTDPACYYYYRRNLRFRGAYRGTLGISSVKARRPYRRVVRTVVAEQREATRMPPGDRIYQTYQELHLCFGSAHARHGSTHDHLKLLIRCAWCHSIGACSRFTPLWRKMDY